MDTEKLRRAGLAFVVAIAGALLWLTTKGDDAGQLPDIGGMAMLAGALIGLWLLAAALIGGRSD